MMYPNITSKAAIFFGSAVSIWDPCNIPAGRKVSDSLLSFLLGDDIKKEWETMGLQDFLEWIPFETINEFAPRSVDLANLYSRIFTTNNSNAIHKQLVKIASSMHLVALLTTNYDNAIELVPESSYCLQYIERGSPLNHVKTPFLKIHGSVTDSDTIIYKLSQETEMAEWKTQVLFSLLDKNELIVLGYSGIDFEICPIIAESGVSTVYWGVKPGTPEAEYKTSGYRIIEATKTIIPFSIDLQKGLPWEHTEFNLDVGEKIDILKELNCISEEERITWSFQLASFIGYSEFAKDITLSSEIRWGKKSSFLRKHLGAPLFESGCFKDSANTFIHLAADYLLKRDFENFICSLLGAYDSYRAGGYIFRASVLLVFSCILSLIFRSHKIKSQLNIKVVTYIKSIKVALQFPLQLDRFKKYAPRLLILALIHIMDKCALTILKQTKKHAIKSHQLFDVKHVDALLTLFEKNKETDLSESISYKSLGFFSASTALFRKNELTELSNSKTLKDAEKRFRLMVFLGNHQEAWKVAIRMSKLTLDSESDLWKNHANYHLERCQYSYLYKKYMPIWVSKGGRVNTVKTD